MNIFGNVGSAMQIIDSTGRVPCPSGFIIMKEARALSCPHWIANADGVWEAPPVIEEDIEDGSEEVGDEVPSERTP